MRTPLVAGLLATLALIGAAVAAPRGVELPEIVFAVNEGATYSAGESPRLSYRAIADDIGRLINARVRIEPIVDYAALAQALRERSVDLALVHPTQISAAAVVSSDYQPLVVSSAHAAYRPYFLCRPGFASSLDDVVRALQKPGAKPIGLPAVNSITSIMARAALSDAVGRQSGAHPPTYKYTRYQDAVVSMIDYGFVDCSVTGSRSVADAWKAAGGRVFEAAQTAPVKTVLISRKFEGETQALRHYFTALASSGDARTKLERIGLPNGFSALDGSRFSELNAWLKRGEVH